MKISILIHLSIFLYCINAQDLSSLLAGLGNMNSGSIGALLSTALGTKNPSYNRGNSENILEKEILQLLQNPSQIVEAVKANRCRYGDINGVCVPVIHVQLCQVLSFQIIPNICPNIQQICCSPSKNASITQVLENAIRTLNSTSAYISNITLTSTTSSSSFTSSSISHNIPTTTSVTTSSTVTSSTTSSILNSTSSSETVINEDYDYNDYDDVEQETRSSDDLNAVDGREFPSCKMNKALSGFCVPLTISGLCQLFNLKITDQGCDDTTFDTCCFGEGLYLQTQEILTDDLNPDFLLNKSKLSHHKQKYLNQSANQSKKQLAVLIHSCNSDSKTGLCLPKQIAELCPTLGMQVNRSACSLHDSCCYGSININSFKNSQLVPYIQTSTLPPVQSTSFISKTVNLCGEKDYHGFCVSKDFSEFCSYFGLQINHKWCPLSDLEVCCYMQKNISLYNQNNQSNITHFSQSRDNINTTVNGTDFSNVTVPTNVSTLSSTGTINQFMEANKVVNSTLPFLNVSALMQTGLRNASSDQLNFITNQFPSQTQGILKITNPGTSNQMPSQLSLASTAMQQSCVINENQGFCATHNIVKVCTAIGLEVTNDGCSSKNLSCCYSKRLSKSTCGLKGSGSIGALTSFNYGNNPKVGEYCWHVALLDKGTGIYFCGGVLIAESWILTAAHCLKGKQADNLIARLGEWDLRSLSEVPGHKDHYVSSLIIHNNFSNKTLEHDLALLKLSAAADLTQSNICTICSPTYPERIESYECIMTGFGQTVENSPTSNVLKAVEVALINPSLCQHYLRNTTQMGSNYNLPIPSFTCAMGLNGPAACFGDGGSPLVCNVNGYHQLMGIVSWGIGCGRPKIPGIYVNIQNYLTWINNLISIK